MSENVFILPSFRGISGPMQAQLDRELPGSRYVGGIDPARPVLAEWTGAIHRHLDRHAGRAWLVAQDFGCLAAVRVAADRGDRLSGVVLISPADPDRFAGDGFFSQAPLADASISGLLPLRPIALPGLLVTGSAEFAMPFDRALQWSARWGIPLYRTRKAGSSSLLLNRDNCPLLLDLFAALRQGGLMEKPSVPSVTRWGWLASGGGQRLHYV